MRDLKEHCPFTPRGTTGCGVLGSEERIGSFAQAFLLNVCTATHSGLRALRIDRRSRIAARR